MSIEIKDYDVVIGLEVHIQLTTNSKLFCSDSTRFGAQANEHISAITLGHPGTMPRINQMAIQQTITLGLSLGCSITKTNYFSRKHYFYPDLPKGFQTTQHVNPICVGDSLNIYFNNHEQPIQIHHIHLEEDAGKSIHDVNPNFTAVDFNRAGTPLCELVTDPCINSSDEAAIFLTELRKLVRWIGVCDGNMEEGSLRCDANVSIKPKGSTVLGTRVEIKNLNSIKFVKKAIDYEVARMTMTLQNGGIIEQETRSFDASTETTFSLRNKEDAMDYRYFIEPDLAPTIITDEMVAILKKDLPSLPQTLLNNLINNYHLSNYDASLLMDDITTYHYFTETISYNSKAKAVANFINGPIKQNCNERNIKISEFEIQPKQIAEILNLIENNTINFSTASNKLFFALLKNPTKTPIELVKTLNLSQLTESNDIEFWVKTILDKYPQKVTEYKKGKKGLIGFFVGEVRKLSKGKAEPKITQNLITQKLIG